MIRILLAKGETDLGSLGDFRKQLVQVGRGGNCDIEIDLPAVSRTHLAIVEDDGDYYVRDVGAANGVRLNGERVEHHLLKTGDRIEIDQDVALVVQVDPKTPRPPRFDPDATLAAGVPVALGEDRDAGPKEATKRYQPVVEAPPEPAPGPAPPPAREPQPQPAATPATARARPGAEEEAPQDPNARLKLALSAALCFAVLGTVAYLLHLLQQAFTE